MAPFNADIEFTRSYFEFMNGVGMLHRFRAISQLAFPKSVEDYAQYFKKIFSNFAKEAAQRGNRIVEDHYLDEPNISIVASQVAENSIKDTMGIVDCISLVFSHSLLDGYLLELIDIAKFIDPEIFCIKLAKDKKVKLQTIVSDSKKKILLQTANSISKEARMQSVVKKTDILYMICSPGDNFISMRDYKFDKSKLRKIDENRQKIIHKPKLTLPLMDIEGDLFYLEKTAIHFLAMIHRKFDLKIVFHPDTKMPITKSGSS